MEKVISLVVLGIVLAGCGTATTKPEAISTATGGLEARVGSTTLSGTLTAQGDKAVLQTKNGSVGLESYSVDLLSMMVRV